MLFFVQTMILNLHIEILAKFLFPPLEEFFPFLLPKIQNRIWNITRNPRSNRDKPLFILRNHLSGNPRNTEIKPFNKTYT